MAEWKPDAPTPRWLTAATKIAWGVAACLACVLFVWLAPVGRRQLDLLLLPELARRVRSNEQNMPRVTVAMLSADAGRVMTPVFDQLDPHGAPSWTTFDEYPRGALGRPPASDEPLSRGVRVAFAGASVAYNFRLEEVQALLARRVEPCPVEVVSIAAPSSFSDTTLVLAKRWLTAWRPDLVVVHDAFTDIASYRIRAIAQEVEARDGRLDQRDLALALADPPETPETRLRTAALAPSARARQALHALVTSWGGVTALSTVGRPRYESMSFSERYFFNAELRNLWPMLGEVDDLAAAVDEYNDATRSLASTIGAPLLDFAAKSSGAAKDFRDNRHFSRAGLPATSVLWADLLAPLVRSRLDPDDCATDAAVSPTVPARLPSLTVRPASTASSTAQEPPTRVIGPIPTRETKGGSGPGASRTLPPVRADSSSGGTGDGL